MREVMNRMKPSRMQLAAGATGAVSLGSTSAHAQTGWGGVAQNTNSNLQNIGNLVIAGAFLLGIFLTCAGLLKLKAAADSGGQQVKWSEGLWRLGVGACLVALPTVTNTSMMSFFNGGTTSPNMQTATFTN